MQSALGANVAQVAIRHVWAYKSLQKSTICTFFIDPGVSQENGSPEQIRTAVSRFLLC